jgi:multiple sugar transport system ATP-binding protein
MPKERDAAYRPYAGHGVEVGIRPEHLLDDARLIDSGTIAMDVTIDVVEPLGSTSLLTFVLGGSSYTAIGDIALMRRPGAKVRLKASAKDIHLIDPVTGAVVHPAQSD